MKTRIGYIIVAAFWIVVMLLVSTKTQAQQPNMCDSLSYSTVVDSTTWNTLMVTGSNSGNWFFVDSIDWNFTACNAVACYVPQGNDPYYFPLIQPTDTVKLCYDAFVYSMGAMTVCNHCDSLIYDFMSDTWITYNSQGNTTGIEELIKNEGMYNMIYDLQGRELKQAPKGKMYIRNRKLTITK